MKKKLQFAALASAVMLNSCMPLPPLYHPNTINAPMFSKKGELTLTAATSSAGTDVQGAYSISDNAGFIFNWSGGNKMQSIYTTDFIYQYDSTLGYITSSTITRQVETGYRFNYGEGGYGFYLKPDANSKLRAEIFGLIGSGNAEAREGWEHYFSGGNYLRYSVQGDIGWLGDMTEGAFSIRAGYLDFSGLQSSLSSPAYSSYFNNSYALYPNGARTSFFIDPAFTFRLGYKGIKLVSQVGCSVPASNQTAFGWEKSWGSIGLQFRINTSGKKIFFN